MPSGGGGRGTTTTNVNLPNVYQPQAQPQADTQYQNINNLILGQGQNAIGALNWTPAQEYWGLAQSYGNQPFQNLGPAGQAQEGSGLAAGAAPGIFDQALSAGGALSGAGRSLLDYLSPLAQNAFDPGYGASVSNIENNPFLTEQLQGANLGEGIGRGAANQAWDNSRNITEQLIPELYNVGRGVWGEAGNLRSWAGQAAGHAGDLLPFARQQAEATVAPIGRLQAGGNQLLESGFDPQGQLFNRLQQQATDQTRASEAAGGLSGTPYATGLESDALKNLNIDWQNQQLQRQAQGLSGAGSAYATAGNLAGEGTSIYNTGLQALNQGLSTAGNLTQGIANLGSATAGIDSAAGGLANTALGLGQGASGLATSSAAGPSNAWNNYNDQVLKALQARGQAGNQGAAGMSALLGGAGQGITQGVGLQDQGANWASQLSGLPFQTQMGQTGSYLDTLNSLIGLGNQNYAQPQQGLQNLESYLGLGQSAGNVQNQIGRSQLAQNQQAFGNQSSIYGGLTNILGGGGGLGSLLFGSGGLSGALGLGSGGLLGGGLSSLFGGGGAAADAGLFSGLGDLSALGGLGFLGL